MVGIAKQLQESFSGLLQVPVEELDFRAPFVEMGADSLVIIDALNIIRDQFRVVLSFGEIFEKYTTIEALAAHIHGVLASRRPAADVVKDCTADHGREHVS